jgi:hypothetical protein
LKATVPAAHIGLSDEIGIRTIDPARIGDVYDYIGNNASFPFLMRQATIAATCRGSLSTIVEVTLASGCLARCGSFC